MKFSIVVKFIAASEKTEQIVLCQTNSKETLFTFASRLVNVMGFLLVVPLSFTYLCV
jgi:hypothetical protein